MRLLTTLAILVFLPTAACVDASRHAPRKTSRVSGYPVYAFLTGRLGIDSDVVKARETMLREELGDQYERYAAFHQAMVSAGFDKHERVQVIGKDRKEIDVYVRSEDYEKLCKVSPHDLKEQGQSHFVTIDYELVAVGGQIVNRATSFQAELVDHEPTVRK